MKEVTCAIVGNCIGHMKRYSFVLSMRLTFVFHANAKFWDKMSKIQEMLPLFERGLLL